MAHILVVDDDEHICGTLSAILLEEGHEIQSAANGALALTLLQQTTFDLILLDMNMPTMNGWQFLAAYSSLPEPRPPVVVCTANEAGSRDGQQLGAVGWLLKPFDIDDLLVLVGRHILASPSP
jgi:CheY-like chemotaxis protein